MLTIQKLSVTNEAATQTSAQCNHHEVSHAFRVSINHFTDRGCISIVGEQAWNSEFVCEHLCERQLVFPFKISRFLDCTRIVVAVSGAYTNANDLCIFCS